MRHLIPVLLACAVPLGTTYAAQDEAQEPTAAERFDALEEAVEIADEEWLTDLRKQIADAEEAGEEVPYAAYTRPYAQFIPKFQAAATDYVGTDDAVQFLKWIATTALRVDEEAGKAAIMTIVEDHASSKELEGFGSLLPQMAQIFGDEEGARLVAHMEKEATDKGVRAWAIFSRLNETLTTAKIDSEEFKKAKAELMAALEGVKDAYLTDTINGDVTVRETFSNGMVAPDIDGIDLDGNAFKLSDYKGKVLFVDFWGDW